MIDKESFEAWLDHPVTREVRKVLAAKRADMRNEWEMSEPASYLDNAFLYGNIANIGMCRGLAFAETIDYETYLAEIDDGEQQRTGPSRSSGPDQNV